MIVFNKLNKKIVVIISGVLIFIFVSLISVYYGALFVSRNYAEKGNYHKAYTYMKISYNLNKTNTNNSYMAIYSNKISEFSESNEYISNISKDKLTEKLVLLKSVNYFELGNIELKEKDYDKAIVFGNLSKDIRESENVYKLLIDCYDSTNDFKNRDFMKLELFKFNKDYNILKDIKDQVVTNYDGYQYVLNEYYQITNDHEFILSLINQKLVEKKIIEGYDLAKILYENGYKDDLIKYYATTDFTNKENHFKRIGDKVVYGSSYYNLLTKETIPTSLKNNFELVFFKDGVKYGTNVIVDFLKYPKNSHASTFYTYDYTNGEKKEYFSVVGIVKILYAKDNSVYYINADTEKIIGNSTYFYPSKIYRYNMDSSNLEIVYDAKGRRIEPRDSLDQGIFFIESDLTENNSAPVTNYFLTYENNDIIELDSKLHRMYNYKNKIYGLAVDELYQLNQSYKLDQLISKNAFETYNINDRFFIQLNYSNENEIYMLKDDNSLIKIVDLEPYTRLLSDCAMLYVDDYKRSTGKNIDKSIFFDLVEYYYVNKYNINNQQKIK